jgi:phage-related protein
VVSKIADFEVTGEASIDPDQMVEDIDAILDKLDELAEKLDEIDATIDEMADKGIEIEVEIVGQDKLDELKLFLDDIEDHEYIVTITVEVEGNDKLDELRLDLDELEDTPHEIDVKLNDADLADDEAKLDALNGQLDETEKKMDSAKDSSDEFSLSMLAPLLAPLSAGILSLVGGVGGLASAFGTMAAPVGLAAYATDQLYTSVSTLYSGLTATVQAQLLASNSMKQSIDILDKNSSAFKAMSSSEQDAALQYIFLKQQLDAFQNEIQPEAATILSAGLNLLAQSIGLLTPAAISAAEAIGEVIQDLSNRLNDPTFTKFFKDMDNDVQLLVSDWGNGIVNIIEGLTALLDAFLPLGVQMSGGFDNMTKSFDTWAQKLATSEGFHKFIQTVETDGPKILTILGEVVHIISNIVGALGEQGLNTKFFDDLATDLGKISNFTSTNQGLTAMAGDLVLVGAAAVKLGPALAPLLSFIASPIGLAVVAIVGLAVGFLEAYNNSKTFRNWVQQNLIPLLNTLESDVKQVKQWFVSIWPDIQKVWQMYGRNIMNIIVTDLTFIVNTITNIMNAIEGIIDIALGILTGNWSLTWKGIKKVFGSIWNEIVSAASTSMSNLENELEMAWTMVSKDVSNLWVEVKEIFTRNFDTIETDVIGFFNQLVNDAGQWTTDFENAIKRGINDVVTFFEQLPGKVLGAIGGTGTLLYNIGVQIMDSLLNGLESMLNDVESFFSKLTSWIPDLKGPPEKDKTLLYDNGALIIGGLIDGMESKYSQVGSSLGGLTKTIGNTFGSKFTTDIQAQVNASLKSVGTNQGLSGGASAAASGSGTVNVNAGAIQITNSVPEKASVSLTKLLQNGSKLGMLQAPIGSPQLPGSVSA